MQVEMNEDNHTRGLHIVIVNPETAKVETAKVFDTYKTPHELDGFVFQDVPENSIVVAACQDECSTKLSWNSKKWFSDMGSQEIWKLQYRHAFAFIGVKGKSVIREKRAMNKPDTVSVAQVFRNQADLLLQDDA